DASTISRKKCGSRWLAPSGCGWKRRPGCWRIAERNRWPARRWSTCDPMLKFDRAKSRLANSEVKCAPEEYHCGQDHRPGLRCSKTVRTKTVRSSRRLDTMDRARQFLRLRTETFSFLAYSAHP